MCRVCEGCFNKEKQSLPPPPPRANTQLTLHVPTGEVYTKSRWAEFSRAREAFNRQVTASQQPVTEAYSQIRQLGSRKDRQQVVSWEKDSTVATCSRCRRGFSGLLRRHHCRTCGLVVCEGCSAHRKASLADAVAGDAFSVRVCNQCESLLARWERAQAAAQLRRDAAQSSFTLQYISLAQTASTARALMAQFEQQVSALGTRAALCTADEARQTQQAIELVLPALAAAIKTFMTAPVSGTEAILREGAKPWVTFSPHALLQASTPRFHVLKRQLDTKVAQKQATNPASIPATEPPAPPTAPNALAEPTPATAPLALLPPPLPPERGAGPGPSPLDPGSAAAPTSSVGVGAPLPAWMTADPSPTADGSASISGASPASPSPSTAPSAIYTATATAATAAAATAPSGRRVASPTDPADFGSGSATARNEGDGPELSAGDTTAECSCGRRGTYQATASGVASNTFAFAAAAVSAAASSAGSWAIGGSSSSATAPTTSNAPSAGGGGAVPADSTASASGCVSCADPVDPALAAAWGVDLAEYLMAKRALADLSRSALLYADPQLSPVGRLDELKELLQTALAALSSELQSWAPSVRLDWNDQLLELSAQIAAPRPGESRFASTKEDLLSRLLGVTSGACSKLEDEVPKAVFVPARKALRELKDTLQSVYISECIPY